MSVFSIEFFYLLPVDIQYVIFVDFIGNHKIDAWKTLGKFDIAHTNSIFRSKLFDIIYTHISMDWKQYNLWIVKIEKGSTIYNTGEMILNMLSWIMKRNISISTIEIDWIMLTKILETCQGTKSFIKTKQLLTQNYSSTNNFTFSSSTVNSTKNVYYSNIIFHHLTSVKIQDVSDTTTLDHLRFLTYLPSNTLKELSLHNNESVSVDILQAIIKHHQLSLQELNIRIPDPSILGHMASYSLPNLKSICMKLDYENNNRIRKENSNNVANNHGEDLFVMFFEKHRCLTTVNIYILSRKLSTSEITNMLTTIFEKGYLQHVKKFITIAYHMMHNQYESIAVIHECIIRLFPKFIQYCPQLTELYMGGLKFEVHVNNNHEQYCKLGLNTSGGNMPFKVIHDYVIDSLPYPLTYSWINEYYNHVRSNEEFECMRKLYYVHEHSLTEIQLYDFEHRRCNDFKLTFLN
jgi:hypothetical protein